MIHPATPSLLLSVTATDVQVGDYIRGRGYVKRVIVHERISMVEFRLDRNRVSHHPDTGTVQVFRNGA